MNQPLATPNQRQIFQSKRSDIAQAELAHADIPELAEGEVLIAVDKFALTANNITYGVAGDTMGYWQFFPAHDPAAEGYGLSFIHI